MERILKFKTYILAASALISGLFLELVPLSFGAWYVVSMGLIPILFCWLIFSLWCSESFFKKVGLLATALLLGYASEEIVIVLRNGVRVFSNIRPGLILLLIRGGIAFSTLIIVHFFARFVRKENV